MMRLALITAIWLLAILTIVLLQHKPQNGGAPLVKTATPTVVWTLTTQCGVNSRNLPMRQPERRA
jgi:hypothetical protein